jgi:hypothetical protein
LAYVWGLFKQNIATSQIEEAGYILCWAAKWLGEDNKVHFDSVVKSGAKKMLHGIHTLMDRADIIVHYNGNKFDIPTLNKEFLLHDLCPPAPARNVDLYQLFKRRFRFESNRLDNVLRRLGLGQKVEHEGFGLWLKCMDPKHPQHKDAWRRMEEYNRGDVTELEKLYMKVRPWLDKHPNRGTYEDALCCPACGSEKFQARGFAVTALMKYRRYQCECGHWFRGNKSLTKHGSDKFMPVPA